MDKDELSAGISRVRSNIAQLFYQGGDEKRLRLVVDLAPPQFDALPSLSPRSSLNEEQMHALKTVLAAKDYALILGMPGTGKTTLITEIIKEEVARGGRILVVSYTHSAVDNLLGKLVDGGMKSVVRLGNKDKVREDLRYLCSEDGEARVVATTCLSIDQ